MRKHFYLRVLVIIFMLTVLSGCAGLMDRTGFPNTVQGKIDLSIATLTGLNEAMTDLINSGLVSLTDALNYQNAEKIVSDNIKRAQALLNVHDEQGALGLWTEINKQVLTLNDEVRRLSAP